MEENNNQQPVINIEEVKPDAPAKKKRNPPKTCPLKHSNWFITINSNKNVNSYQKEELEKLISDFRATIQEFYNDKLKNLEFFVMEGSKQAAQFNMPRDAPKEELIKRIKDITAKFVVEVGPESFKLHSHGLIAVSKRGLDTKLSYTAIKDWLKNKLGYEVHFCVRLYNDAQKSLDQYISKNPFK